MYIFLLVELFFFFIFLGLEQKQNVREHDGKSFGSLRASLHPKPEAQICVLMK